MTARTQFDVDVDYSDAGLVRAPFRVRTELRHAPPAHPEYGRWREPKACTSDSVSLETFRATTVVGRPINERIEGAQV